MDLSWKRGLKLYGIFFISFIIFFYLQTNVPNYFVLSGLLALIGLFIFLIINQRGQALVDMDGKTSMRYTLLCHNCNWEWMSNVTDKKYTNKCPNCGESSKIEVIGARKVHKIPKKNHKDLTSYFKK